MSGPALLRGSVDKTAPHQFSGAVGMAFGYLRSTWWLFAIISGIVIAVRLGAAHLLPEQARLYTPAFRTVHGMIRISIVGTVVSIILGGWINATIVALIVDHARRGVKPALNRLGAGLPFLLWFIIGSAATWALTSVARWYLNSIGPVLVVLVFVSFVFYQQLIVDRDLDIVAALRGSAALVRGRYLDVIASLLLGGLCYVAIVVVGLLIGAAAGSVTYGAVFVTLVSQPFLLVYVTVMYYLAVGNADLMTPRRGDTEAELPPASV